MVVDHIRRRALLACALMLVLGLAACGGAKSEPAGTDAGGESAQDAGADNPAPADVTSPAPAGDPQAGAEVFAGTCSSCHGPAAAGIEGLGKDLRSNTYVAERTDEEMLAFVKVGRGPTDPLNTTGVQMPPKGGNPALSDEDLLNVIAYIRTLEK